MNIESTLGSSQSARSCRLPHPQYYDYYDLERDPDRRSDRAKRDEELEPEIERVWKENFEVYGVKKVWRQVKCEGFEIARCTVRD